MKTVKIVTLFFAAGAVLLSASCTPTIKVQAPDKPIHLIVDINIKQEILLKVERDVEGISVTPAIPLAKRAGWIGERTDGYLGLVVMDAPRDVKDIVLQANEDRRDQYVVIANKHKTKLDLIETVAGKRFVEKSAAGEFVQVADGSWIKK